MSFFPPRLGSNKSEASSSDATSATETKVKPKRSSSSTPKHTNAKISQFQLNLSVVRERQTVRPKAKDAFRLLTPTSERSDGSDKAEDVAMATLLRKKRETRSRSNSEASISSDSPGRQSPHSARSQQRSPNQSDLSLDRHPSALAGLKRSITRKSSQRLEALDLDQSEGFVRRKARKEKVDTANFEKELFLVQAMNASSMTLLKNFSSKETTFAEKLHGLETILQAAQQLQETLKPTSKEVVNQASNSVGVNDFDIEELLFGGEVKHSANHADIVKFFDMFLLDVKKKIPTRKECEKKQQDKTDKEEKKPCNKLKLLKWLGQAEMSDDRAKNLSQYADRLNLFLNVLENELDAITPINIPSFLSPKELGQKFKESEIPPELHVILNSLNDTIEKAFNESERRELGDCVDAIMVAKFTEYKIRYKEFLETLKFYLAGVHKEIGEDAGKTPPTSAERSPITTTLTRKSRHRSLRPKHRDDKRSSLHQSTFVPNAAEIEMLNFIQNHIDSLMKCFDSNSASSSSQIKLDPLTEILEINRLVKELQANISHSSSITIRPRARSIGVNFNDVQHLLRGDIAHTADHRELVMMIKQTLANLNDPITSKRTHEKLLYWEDETHLGKTPLASAFIYKNAITSLIDLFENVQNECKGNGKIPTQLQEMDGVDPKVVAIYNTAIHAIEKISKNLTPKNAKEEERQEQLRVTFNVRLPQVIALYKRYVTSIKDDLIPHMLKDKKHDGRYNVMASVYGKALTDFPEGSNEHFLIRTLSEVTNAKQFGFRGQHLAEGKGEVAHAQEWVYALENAALTIINGGKKAFPIVQSKDDRMELPPVEGDNEAQTAENISKIKGALNHVLDILLQSLRPKAPKGGSPAKQAAVEKQIRNFEEYKINIDHMKMFYFDGVGKNNKLDEILISFGFKNLFGLDVDKIQEMYDYISTKDQKIENFQNKFKCAHLDADLLRDIYKLFVSIRSLKNNIDQGPYERFDGIGVALKCMAATGKLNIHSGFASKTARLLRVVNQQISYVNYPHLNGMFEQFWGTSLLASLKGFEKADGKAASSSDAIVSRPKLSKKYELELNEGSIRKAATALHVVLEGGVNTVTPRVFFRERFVLNTNNDGLDIPRTWKWDYQSRIIIQQSEKEKLSDTYQRIVEDFEVLLLYTNIAYNIVYKEPRYARSASSLPSIQFGKPKSKTKVR